MALRLLTEHVNSVTCTRLKINISFFSSAQNVFSKMILADYIHCIKYSIFNISVEFQDIEFHQSWKAKIKLL